MAQIDYTALGNRIRQCRKNNNITQEKLAEICSLSAAHIGHIERGTRIPSLDTVYRIACELGVSIDWLLFDSAEGMNSVFCAISENLADKKERQVKKYLATVKALADKIDEL